MGGKGAETDLKFLRGVKVVRTTNPNDVCGRNTFRLSHMMCFGETLFGTATHTHTRGFPMKPNVVFGSQALFSLAT
jgi:hypothetical protein